MDYEIDLDPTHSVIRLTVIEAMVSLECAEDCYKHLSQFAASGGPYAAIYNLSMAKNTTIPTETIRNFARRSHPIPGEQARVLVGKQPVIYGLGRLFQICLDDVGQKFEVVHTLEEAYNIVGVRAEDFTMCHFIGPKAA